MQENPGDLGYEAPEDIRYAVEEWAKNFGRQARIAFAPYPPGAPVRAPGCFTIFLERKQDDPMRNLGRKWEAIPLQVWNKELGDGGEYEPLNLDDYGASGIVQLLQKGDTWSGRGEYKTMVEAAKAAIGRMEDARKEQKAKAGVDGAESAWLHRRSLMGIPYNTVGIDLKQDHKQVAADADKE